MILADVTLMEILGALDRVGMAGLAVVVLWFVAKYFTKRVDEKNTAIKDKDTRIQELETKLQDQATAHATKIEELQERTIGKVENWGQKMGELVERNITMQADTNAALRQLRVVQD